MPLVSLSSLCIVLKFFRLYSLARMNTTVLWRYRPHGCTCNPNIREIYLPRKQLWKLGKRERDGRMIGLKIPNGVREKRARIIVLLYLRKSWISGNGGSIFIVPPRLFLFAPCLLFKKKFSLRTRKIRGVISIHFTYRPIKSS